MMANSERGEYIGFRDPSRLNLNPNYRSAIADRIVAGFLPLFATGRGEDSR
jgi:hypothetical protein